MYCAKYTCTSREISYLKVTEHWFLTFKQSFLFSVRFSTTVRLYLIWLCVKKTNLNRKDRDKDVGHQTAWSAKKRSIHQRPFAPNSRPANARLQNFFYIKTRSAWKDGRWHEKQSFCVTWGNQCDKRYFHSM